MPALPPRAGGTPVRSSKARMAIAPSSGAGNGSSDPRNFPIGVRTPAAALDVVRWLGTELQVTSVAPPLDLASSSRIEMLYAAQQILNTPSASAATLKALTDRLRDWTSSNLKDIDAWSFLAQSQLMQNQRVRSSMSTAEGLRAQLDDSAALAQYLAAQGLIRQGLPADSVDAAIVDSKVRELQSLVRDSTRKPGR